METHHTDQDTAVVSLQWVHVISERTGHRWVAEHVTATDYVCATVRPVRIPDAPRLRYASTVFIARDNRVITAPKTYTTRRTARQWCQRTMMAQLQQDAAPSKDES